MKPPYFLASQWPSSCRLAPSWGSSGWVVCSRSLQVSQILREGSCPSHSSVQAWGKQVREKKLLWVSFSQIVYVCVCMGGSAEGTRFSLTSRKSAHLHCLLKPFHHPEYSKRTMKSMKIRKGAGGARQWIESNQKCHIYCAFPYFRSCFPLGFNLDRLLFTG